MITAANGIFWKTLLKIFEPLRTRVGHPTFLKEPLYAEDMERIQTLALSNSK